MSDEPYSAERCAALGIGRAVAPAERTPEAIRDAVRSLLNDPSYRARAQELSAEMHALPGTERFVELLTGLARNRAATSAQPAT
jgi:UDP:flavonoid glycosyltransferase YjiC (YdhE family)